MPAGWYPDPADPSQHRWWDGEKWSDAPGAFVPSTTTTSNRWRPSALTVIVGSVALVIAIISAITSGFGGFLIALSLFGIAGGVWTLGTRKPGFLNLAGRRAVAVAVTSTAAAALLLGVIAVPKAASHDVALQVASASTATPAPTVTPTPTHTPVTKTETVDVSEAVPFAATSYEDDTAEVGTNVVVTPGVPGTKVSTYKVTTVDGVETERTLVSEVVTVPPTDEVTAIGVAQPAPPPAAEPAPPAASPIHVNPGGFCSDSLVGVTATADNGREYTCGGNGPDANGKYHWNK
ncbi:G5 domain-containing protein [Cnuibacter physcomitrellae]|uniref:G5 domain-containing protein n=1 Tax=Cnuibacter physcomitrellae TaxID=1619308 RepID=UPI0021760E29|nr:G5 domain-containing protein [Cnuibacter physcomitrellae]MCS5495626.1 G5 domain-containing protein [Cnuibacter physcomitrellae]